MQPKVQRVDIDRNATFNCSIVGGPVDSVLWKKDMRFLDNNPRVSFPIPTVLQLSRATRQDGGMYQCFAIREYRVSQGSAQLIIGGEYLFVLLKINDIIDIALFCT